MARPLSCWWRSTPTIRTSDFPPDVVTVMVSPATSTGVAYCEASASVPCQSGVTPRASKAAQTLPIP